MDTVTLTIDGQQVTVAKVPRLHREDREDAEAADLVLDDVYGRHGRLDARR
jgi:hypothetical protein